VGPRVKREMDQVVYIYVIRLDDIVLTRPKFVARDPDYRKGKPCYYVGSSIYKPAVRFAKHKAGERASRWVKDYGLWVAKRKCKRIRVTTGSERYVVERAYATELRRQGYGVWQN